MPRPVLVTTLSVVQFVATALLAVVVLGHGTLDSELSPVDVATAVGVAIVGATAATSSWNGGRGAWAFEVVVAIAVGAFGAWRLAAGDLPYLVVGAVVWLAVLLVPANRRWFETAAPA